MGDDTRDPDSGAKADVRPQKRVRADAQRSVDALLNAAMAVFATSGVDAPVREIAEKAGVGIGTVYRNFPQRADLVAAVFRQEVDACAAAAPLLSAEHMPGEALARWMQRYADFIAAKRGLASALHSGDPTFDSLPGYFQQRLTPALRDLLTAAEAAGDIRVDVDAEDLLNAVARLCMSAPHDRSETARSMVALLIDGFALSWPDAVRSKRLEAAFFEDFPDDRRRRHGIRPARGISL